MIRAFLISFLVTLTISMAIVSAITRPKSIPPRRQDAWWSVQSIDTMKYSRDLAREKGKDLTFDDIIDAQVKNIADTGATHVAIATPYDEEFIPMLTRWVTAARKYNLHVWFRGNFSGWERWFDFAPISHQEHLEKTVAFIHKHKALFIDGDIFTACPECENGGPGDPRQTGDVDEFRLFMITEHSAINSAFTDIHRKVISNYNSMNYDVASLVMDAATTASMGGVVAIDHYVASPTVFRRDVQRLASASGGKIFVGEFGAPIPDIHGEMNDAKQAEWIEEAMFQLSDEKSVIGTNYWVNQGGSTELWYNEKTPKAAVASLAKYFIPKHIRGTVYDQYNHPIANAEVTTSHKATKTDRSGQFSIPVLASDTNIFVHVINYTDMETQITGTSDQIKIIIRKTDHTLITGIMDYFNNLLR